MAQNRTGLIHIYCGNGKGKTTAATGLAVRAAGAGKKVIFAQFFKDGSSSEIKSLSALDNVSPMHCVTEPGRYSTMDDASRTKASADYSRFLEEVIAAAADGCDLLVLDEIISSCNHGVVSEDRVAEFLRNKPAELEVVLTGRDPSDRLVELGDYVTEMRKIKHPYDRGITAREGIEF